MSTSAMSLQSPSSATMLDHRYGISSYAAVSCPLGDIAELRSRLTDLEGKPFAPSFLKPANEQTITAIAAILNAMKRRPLPGVDFTDWGVIAAARYIGRLNAAATTHQFRIGGAWKASPLFVPHHFLHSISGTISQAFKIHGPNFGVGGGPHAAEEGLLTCLTFLNQYQPPGLWAVFSECDPEPLPDAEGKNDVPVVCHAAALAFVPAEDERQILRLTVRDAGGGIGGPATTDSRKPENQSLFTRLREFIREADRNGVPASMTHLLSWGCELRLSSE